MRFFLLALAVTTAGCSIDKMAANNMVPILKRTDDSFERSRSPKAARQAGPGLLFTLDGLIATSPEDGELLILGAQMNATFAFAFVEDEDEEWAKELYDKARDYARRALPVRDEDLLKDVGSPLDGRPQLDAIKKKDVAPLFWLAFAWGSRI